MKFRFQNIPAPLRMEINMYRAKPLWRDKGLIFIHVPKNGGTSVNNAIFGRFMGHFIVQDVVHRYAKLYQQLPSFALARNPWSRIYSAYRFVKMGKAMQDGAQVKDPEKYQSSVFDSFDSFVSEWLDGRDLSKEDMVFRSQMSFLRNVEGTLGVDHLGYLENPRSYVEWVEEVLGHSLNLQHLNKTSNEDNYRKAYNPISREIVSRMYADDISELNYDF